MVDVMKQLASANTARRGGLETHAKQVDSVYKHDKCSYTFVIEITIIVWKFPSKNTDIRLFLK